VCVCVSGWAKQGFTRKGLQSRIATASHANKKPQIKGLLFWLRKADTFFKPAGWNRDASVLQRETTCGQVQWKRTYCSYDASCTSLRYHKSWVRGEVLWVQVTVSIHRVWVARNVMRKRSRDMYLGRMYGERVTRALLVGRTHNWW